MLKWITECVPLACAVVALIIGANAWTGGKRALFPKLVASAIGCYALGSLHEVVYYLVQGNLFGGIYLGFLGTVGCFLFLLSSSYGQLDRLFDDGNRAFRKWRLLPVIGSLAVVVLFAPIFFSEEMHLPMKLVAFLGWLPCILAAYYNGKHAIFPDCGFLFVKAVRPYNAIAFGFSLLQTVFLQMRIVNCAPGITICACLTGIFLIGLMYFAKKGAREWTI